MEKGVHKKIVVGLSGGVDSSVSAALLQSAGYDCTGVFIKVWQPEFIKCTSKEDRLDAMRVSASFDMPFHTFDFEDVYKREVIDHMIREYTSGYTPNPDVMCNRYVKFGAFLEEARSMGADAVATGHYAQNIFNPQTKLHELHMGADPRKDQTYFLWTLTQNDLKDILFPVGHLKKAKVRSIADKLGLITAQKKDSQGLCFIGKLDLKEFLGQFVELKEGDVLDEEGNILGKHTGAILYTIGQRHGFTALARSRTSKPQYVVSKNIGKNTITVSARSSESVGTPDKGITKIPLKNVNWISGKPLGGEYNARFRHRQKLFPCKLVSLKEKTTVHLHEPRRAVPKGQSFVLYDKTKCLGGGIIA